jgi:hypothetical protein
VTLCPRCRATARGALRRQARVHQKAPALLLGSRKQWTRAEGFGETPEPYRVFLPRRHGHDPR